MNSRSILTLLSLLLILNVDFSFVIHRVGRVQLRSFDTFYPKDYYTVVNPADGIVSQPSGSNDSADGKEVIFRKYRHQTLGLPILKDCDNYYSGNYGDSFWLQNADQVFVFIPIINEVKQNDISVSFTASSISISIDNDKVPVESRQQVLPCAEKLIPAGSFWTLESDNLGQRYIQLDIEKR